MPIAICGVYEVPSYADTPLDHIISFHERGTQPGPNVTGFNHPFTLHSFVFADRTMLTEPPDGPNEENMRRLLAVFAATKPTDQVLFHCFAGSSRSTAAAYLWLVHHGATIEQAFATLMQIHPQSTVTREAIRPNLRMIKIADDLLGHGGKMVEYVALALGRADWLTQ